jgi:hypothetical protein
MMINAKPDDPPLFRSPKQAKLKAQDKELERARRDLAACQQELERTRRDANQALQAAENNVCF